jgi:hypothetical protein
VFEIHIKESEDAELGLLPELDMIFTFHDAMILLMLEDQPLHKDFLARELVHYGLDPKSEGFKAAKQRLRRTTSKTSAFPILKLNTVGYAMAGVLGEHIKDTFLPGKARQLPILELLAAVLRLEGRIDLSMLINDWSLIAALTLEDAKKMHVEKRDLLGLDFDQWLEIGVSAGVCFWFGGLLWFLQLPKKQHIKLLRGTTLFQTLLGEDA